MKYLVTGGTGFLGRYIVNYLQQTGNEVFITTRHPQKPSHILADFEKSILNIDSNAGFIGDDQGFIIIHAAGKAHVVPRTEAEKKAFFDVNVSGTQLLLEKLGALPVLPKAIIFISSVGVYGRETGIEINEEEALNAIEPYGKSKIEAEILIKDWGKKHHIVTGILRLPLIVGNNPPGNLKSMINGIKSGRYFRLGAGAARKSMVWAQDIAAILPTLAQKGGTYNLTDGYHPSFAELEDRITTALHLKPVKKMPMFLAHVAAIAGTLAETLSGKKMPINRNMVSKIVKPLTFSDQKARENLGWRPSLVLDHVNEMLP